MLPPLLSHSWTRFVDVQSLRLVPAPPTTSVLLDQITSHPPDANELLLDLGSLASIPEVALVPLAGVLLEYPVAYVVPPNTDAYLPGVALNVFECTLADGRDYSWLKFSCPAALGEHDLCYSPSNMLATLHARFGPRLAAHSVPASLAGPTPRLSLGPLRASHTAVALPRVAL
jgi:hypothetical protein